MTSLSKMNLYPILFTLCITLLPASSIGADNSQPDGFFRSLVSPEEPPPLPLFNKEERNWLKNNPVIHYAAETDWPPFDFTNEDGLHDGYSKDILDLIAPIIGVEFVPVINDWATLLKKADTDEIDLYPVLFYTEERKNILDYTTAYKSILNYFYSNTTHDKDYPEDLSGLTLAIPKSFAHIDNITKLYPQIDILEVDTLMQAINKVLEHEADLLLDSQAVINFLLKTNSIYSIHPIKPFRENEPENLHMATNKRHPILRGIINKAIKAIPENQKLQLHYKWFQTISNKTDPVANNITELYLSPLERQWLDDHPNIRFAGDPNWLPYEAFDNSGDYIGIVAEHLNIIEQRLGIELSIIQTNSWVETVQKARAGEIDLISETTDSNLNSIFDFTQVYIESPVVIIMRNDQEYVGNISQIRNQKIIVIKEYGYVPEIRKKYPNLDYSEVATIQEGLTSVLTGKRDALFVTLAQASYHMSELGINGLRIVGTTEFSTKLAIGVKQDYLPLIPLLNRALNSIKENQRNEVMSKWRRNDISATNYSLIFKITLGFFIVIIIVLYWVSRLRREIRLRKETEHQNKALLDNIPLNVVVTEVNGTVISANPIARTSYIQEDEDLSKLRSSNYYKNPETETEISQEMQLRGRVDQKIVEFRGLDGTFRSMLISIIPIKYLKKTVLLNIGIDLTERLQLEQDLKQAKDVADQSNKAKSEFLANMSHEIRTPMNAIIGFTELLHSQIKDEKLKSFVSTIKSAGKSLLLLINDILDLSKIESGKLKISIEPINPYSTFEDICNIFFMTAANKNIELILDIDPDTPSSLILDSARIRQVLFNIIGNAVKFTEEGYVKVSLKTFYQTGESCHLKITIEDTGIGIKPENIDNIFESFQQQDDQDVKKFGGTGLGLAISKRLSELMGGKLSVESELDKGSCFTIYIEGVAINNKPVQSIPFQSKTSQGDIIFDKAKVLIVDDIEDNRLLLEEVFRTLNIRTKLAENGEIAVTMVESQPFDLVMMDIRMPVMDGYTAAKIINKTHPHLPIVALTASVMLNDDEQENTEGFNGYLRKPALRKDLIAELTKHLSHTFSNKKSGSLMLSENALIFSDEIIDRLQDYHLPICIKLLTSNNLNDINHFSQELTQFAMNHSDEILKVFATELQASCEAFNIAEIKRALKSFILAVEE